MNSPKALQRPNPGKPKKIIPPPRRNNQDKNNWELTNPLKVPMMYRAQIDDRCSLQYPTKKYGRNYLKEWTEEWVYPDENNNNQPFYQHKEPKLGLDGSVYRIKIEFPFRVFTNCGQDSILRPNIGKNGIPFIPGSSIKGLFKRLRTHPALLQNSTDGYCQAIDDYCGTEEKAGILRFHGAYPVGDWAETRTVKKNGREEISYGMVDVVHPQQERQVKHQGDPQAIAIISFCHPTFIFELSAVKPLPKDEWKKIGGWLEQALKPGLGGKTSTGYGLSVMPKDKYPLSVELEGKGVSPLLRSGEPEFRPNLFKATLRGHVTRLLAGASNNRDDIEKKIDRLFGCTKEPGDVELYWQSESEPKHYTFGEKETQVYEIKGELFLDAPEEDLNFLQKVLEFTLVMAGLGKSWRRVWHREFFPTYETHAIGCHWKWLNSNFERTKIESSDDLKKFLDELHKQTKQYMGVSLQDKFCTSWYEAWSPSRLVVFSQEVSESKAIRLFHNDKFKTTPAIGGRKPGDNRPTSCSLVWHRMLPIYGNKYLEIFTLFHDGNLNKPLKNWQRKNDDGYLENMLPLFVNKLQDEYGFQQTWGKLPEEKERKVITRKPKVR